MKKRLILIDGTAFLFRAYFSTLSHNLSNNEGFPTGAMFGVVNAIKKLEKQFQGSKLISIFDAKGKNHRHDLYPEYKANRKDADEDLIRQIEPLYEIVRAMKTHFLCIDRVEADDVIATLSKQANERDCEVVIASGDKDLMQLVNDNTRQLDMKGNMLDHEGVVEKSGVNPEQILDLLALTGDSSDNIPGVPSVGPKTAVKWINEFGSINKIKENADQISGKVGEKLRESFDLLDMSYELVKLKQDVEIPYDIFEQDPVEDPETLRDLYKKYGFNSWLKELGTSDKTSDIKEEEKQQSTASDSPIDSTENINFKEYTQTVVYEETVLDSLIERMNIEKKVVLDLETNSLDYLNASVVGLVILLGKDSFYIPVGHDYMDAPAQLNRDEVMSKLKPILENENISKIGQNLKYDSHVLANYRIQLKGIKDDTMVKSYVLNSIASRHNMDDLSEHYLNHKTIKFSDVAGTGKNQLTFNQIDIDIAAPYACEDVIVTNMLNQVFEEKIEQYSLLKKLYQDLEIPLISTLVNIERNGVVIDPIKLSEQQKDIKNRMLQLQEEAYKTAKQEFNLESPKQVSEILFGEDGLKLEPKKKTPKGAPSTNEEALKLLEHPLAETILNYRTLTKLNSTYLEALPKQIDQKTQRLHTSYHQAVTATGRLSSTSPNLQNIPIKTEDGAKIRSAFIAQKGNRILAADYSQIELRIMAHLSNDEALIHAFNRDLDIHSATASQIFSIDINEVTKDHRRKAKAINFGLIYGMSAFGLAKQIGISRTEAKNYIDSYFETYTGVAEFMEQTKVLAKTQGYVETVLGRRLYLPDVNSRNKMAQQHALRTAINAPMQGSSADIIKQAMIDIDSWINQNDIDIKMIMQVHDELVFEVPEDIIDSCKNRIEELMSNAIKLSIPLKVDVGVGNNWQEAH
jgi:DNA polymerase-1